MDVFFSFLILQPPCERSAAVVEQGLPSCPLATLSSLRRLVVLDISMLTMQVAELLAAALQGLQRLELHNSKLPRLDPEVLHFLDMRLPGLVVHTFASHP